MDAGAHILDEDYRGPIEKFIEDWIDSYDIIVKFIIPSLAGGFAVVVTVPVFPAVKALSSTWTQFPSNIHWVLPGFLICAILALKMFLCSYTFIGRVKSKLQDMGRCRRLWRNRMSDEMAQMAASAERNRRWFGLATWFKAQDETENSVNNILELFLAQERAIKKDLKICFKGLIACCTIGYISMEAAGYFFFRLLYESIGMYTGHAGLLLLMYFTIFGVLAIFFWWLLRYELERLEKDQRRE